jgi:hypothetical protein
MGMSGRSRMPRLHPPQGVTLEPQGGGRWNSEVRVETDRSVADLEAHFASQLVEAGWTRLSGRTDDVVGWSSCLVPWARVTGAVSSWCSRPSVTRKGR